jgi:hypothetical protein
MPPASLKVPDLRIPDRCVKGDEVAEVMLHRDNLGQVPLDLHAVRDARCVAASAGCPRP